MAVTFNGSGGVQIPNQRVNEEITINPTAHINMGVLMNDNDGYTVMSSGITQLPLTRTYHTPKNMTLGTNEWTHAYTGVYMCHVTFRQANGVDIWNIMAVSKINNASIVGQSARMGSEGYHRECFHIMYKVDSTTSAYRLVGWADGTITASGRDTSSPTSWSSSVTTIGAGTYPYGRSLDISIYRVGGL